MLLCVLSVSLMIMVHETYSSSLQLYVSSSSKRKAFIEKGIYLPGSSDFLIIPHGQCSGFIDKSLLCPYQNAGSVEVIVKDHTPFPNINIENGLHNATVLRTRNELGRCDQEAEVQILTSCVVFNEHKRRRRSIRFLPPAPTMDHNQ
ncbi:hypothetical protein KGM_201910 [Danaus plexippus plexippus]|uniref:Uncharacterized protein n=1 Tax=Danaus plexippus plexippus TaxID=278856 RepID=A0A212F7G8_DANPL|nr:hypothetical protein KGM_201910 [Danaus plexippus plexippus]